MSRKVIFTVALSAVLVLVGLGLGEIIARIFTTVSPDGQVYLNQRRLLPYRFPAEMTKYKIGVYREKQDQAYTVDDPNLGWTIGPNRNSDNKLYHSNSQGLRSAPREYQIKPSPGTLRIALFGDSFTHGDEEPWFNTWAALLESDLLKEGIRTEVLNFGVGGYGFGQAYLRWQTQGCSFHPDIVIIGFQAENMKRTVNIFRSLYSDRTWLVFSKPRFIITPQGLQTVNFPVLEPKQVAPTLKDLEKNPLSKFEFWYNPANYQAPFWTVSRLGQLLYNLGRSGLRDRKTYEEMEKNGGVPEEVTIRIIREWVKDIRREGQIPIIAHLPRKGDINLLAKHQKPAYYSLLEELIAEGETVVDPAPKMINEHRLYRRSHYSAKGNRIVAAALAKQIKDIVDKRGWKERLYCTPTNNDDIFLLEQLNEDGSVTIDIGDPTDEPYLVGGFHERELFQNHTSARWTDGTAQVRMPLGVFPSGNGILEVSLTAGGPEGTDLTVLFDEEALSFKESTEKIKRFTLPNLPQKKVGELILGTKAWKPSEAGNPGDRRTLGLMIDQIRVIPAPTP